jgi:ABC-2 type transport system permease protein
MTVVETTGRVVEADDRRASVSLWTQGTVLARSLLTAWLRDPALLVQAIVFPVFLLLMFRIVFGDSTSALGAGNSIYRFAALVALVGAVQGTLMTGMYLAEERAQGLVGRLWTLPVPRAGFLTGRLIAEGVRIVLSTIVVYAVAFALGLRFSSGFFSGVAALLVPVLFGISWALLVIAVATVAGKAQIEQLGVPFLLLMFFTTGFAPADQYPGWLQPIVRYQPMSTATDAMAGLTTGGAVATPLLLTVAWTAGLSILLGALAVRGYRRAAQCSI